MLRPSPRLLLFPSTAGLVLLLSCSKVPYGEDLSVDPVDLHSQVDGAKSDLANLADLALPPDGGLGTRCAALSGICVPGKWATCPAGRQPTEDVHADCKPDGASRGYFCCVPAPAASCSDRAEGMMDCFAGDCHPCYGPVTDPNWSCSLGRKCCQYVCLD